MGRRASVTVPTKGDGAPVSLPDAPDLRPARDVPDLMTVSEVSDFLRVRQRTVYELVRTQRIPNCKLSGRLLFPKRLIELWVVQSSYYPKCIVASGGASGGHCREPRSAA